MKRTGTKKDGITVSVTIRFPADVYEEILSHSRRERRSFNAQTIVELENILGITREDLPETDDVVLEES